MRWRWPNTYYRVGPLGIGGWGRTPLSPPSMARPAPTLPPQTGSALPRPYEDTAAAQASSPSSVLPPPRKKSRASLTGTLAFSARRTHTLLLVIPSVVLPQHPRDTHHHR